MMALSIGGTTSLAATTAVKEPVSAQPGAQAAIAAEERKVQDDLNSARVLPVVKVSVGYQF